MKYIRMERTISYRSLYKLRSVGEKIFAVDYCGENHEFIKEADTIEELCDAFVYVTNENNHYIKDKHNAVQLFFDNEKPVAYYGAIWTDKGLIYVAKMNREGELELL